MDRIEKDQLAENSPNPELYVLSEAADLGTCDAFVSHSWHDNPELKWEALQGWRS